MIARAEASQLHLLAILDLLRVTVPPLKRHIRVRVGIDQHVKRAIPVQNWKESDRRRDLAKDGLDLFLDLCIRLLRSGFGRLCFPATSSAPRQDQVWESGPNSYSRATFSLSVAFRAALPFVDLLEICTSNCHLSTCSPVSLLVITTTSFEILPPVELRHDFLDVGFDLVVRRHWWG